MVIARIAIGHPSRARQKHAIACSRIERFSVVGPRLEEIVSNVPAGRKPRRQMRCTVEFTLCESIERKEAAKIVMGNGSRCHERSPHGKDIANTGIYLQSSAHEEQAKCRPGTREKWFRKA